MQAIKVYFFFYIAFVLDWIREYTRLCKSNTELIWNRSKTYSAQLHELDVWSLKLHLDLCLKTCIFWIPIIWNSIFQNLLTSKPLKLKNNSIPLIFELERCDCNNGMQLQRSDCYQSKGLGGGGEFKWWGERNSWLCHCCTSNSDCLKLIKLSK